MSNVTAGRITVVLATIGLVIAGYLTWVHFEESALVCGLGDCATVQASRYSELFGIPIALLGVLMFVTILALAAIRWLRPVLEDATTTIILFLTGTGVLYYAYLTYIEIWVLEAICQWCVLSSIMTVGILAIEARRFLGNAPGPDAD